ncbi:MAG: hypothetical protein K0S82_39 [Gaiellaceae bacterium]|jgi:hypothetical protein|nr:hypothetical protein [Gaiellaceae bacterium]
MSDVQSNISLGREVELYNRVDSSDPTNAAFIMLILALSGIVSDSALKEYDTVSDLLAGATNEVANSGYARKTLTDANLSAYVVDDVNDRIVLTLPLQTFATIGVGDVWGKVCVAYDPDTTVGTDTTLVPISYHDCLDDDGENIIPNGLDIDVDLSSAWIIAT